MRLFTFTLFAIAVVISTPAFSATGSGPGASGGLDYSCKSASYPHIPTCMCDGGRDSADCKQMAADGVCDGKSSGRPDVEGLDEIDGILCSDTLCSCTWGKRDAPEFSRVPERATQPSEVAPVVANPRDHRGNSRRDAPDSQRAKATENSRRIPRSDKKVWENAGPFGPSSVKGRAHVPYSELDGQC